MTIADSAALHFGTSDYAILAVIEQTGTPTGNSMILQKAASAYPFAGPALSTSNSVGQAVAQVSADWMIGSEKRLAQSVPYVLTAYREEDSLEYPSSDGRLRIGLNSGGC
jgi:hypothetical protein